ncbi:MAPEG family protein [Sphingopyxis sp. GW247-27LB]|uniref:MAPEG family protein n=1 Tax=Sphingopyxis sp. GW247-27LB TaxID=2012632 RepID=UPI000BA651D9|nr:MAPEG family protein [Sphingopyxis sp. GW247-27LB]PAL21563.1 hypothetical protein CD928_14430 [Sphingopyxis sp. GW247-27LB]
MEAQDVAADWRRQRRKGIGAIAASAVVAAALWLAIRHLAPPLAEMETVADRLTFAFKCWCLAVFFCLAMGVEAVAHERLQSPAFDPLAGYETRRLRVNQRYLQNTLEQLILFTAALFGLALYSDDGDGMRAVEATAFVWILFRFVFWIGYHRSAAMRGLGAPGLMLSLIVLAYVIVRIGLDLGGPVAAAGAMGLFLAIEAVLFRTTRARPGGGEP